MKTALATPPDASLAALRFDNRFVRELSADPDTQNRVRQVYRSCYSRVEPTRVAAPRLVACAAEVAELLDLAPAACQSEAFAQVFVGNQLLPGMEPYAMCYGGHQFGHWAGQLGDGRAINLGEVLNRRGEHWTLQLKGAGLTPYARTADGLAVLRSSLREFLCSEAMQHLGVPTTRALSLLLTGEQVTRDMFYDGHPRQEPGAVVCRVAPSFIRFGSFEIFSSRQELEPLRQLVDYTLRSDFPELGAPSVAVYLQWFAEVCRRTAALLVHWMRVGFVHGVMNTDNMSILGLTIDYGPYGWLEDYDPGWTPNTTDAGGKRYRFGHQPQIALWNLTMLANAIYPLIEQVEPLQAALQVYIDGYQQGWQAMMAQKLGLGHFDAETDISLTTELDRVLQLVETDMTIFYRRLAELQPGDEQDDDGLIAPLLDAYYQPEDLSEPIKRQIGDWLRGYLQRVAKDGRSFDERRQQMNAVNPKYVLRNYLAQLAIDKAEAGDFGLVNEQLEVLRHPYDEQPENEKFAEKRPEWARHRAGCSMLSCSS
jgi:protein adenylyltransferase